MHRAYRDYSSRPPGYLPFGSHRRQTPLAPRATQQKRSRRDLPTAHAKGAQPQRRKTRLPSPLCPQCAGPKPWNRWPVLYKRAIHPPPGHTRRASWQKPSLRRQPAATRLLRWSIRGSGHRRVTKARYRPSPGDRQIHRSLPRTPRRQRTPERRKIGRSQDSRSFRSAGSNRQPPPGKPFRRTPQRQGPRPLPPCPQMLTRHTTPALPKR